MTRAQPSLPRSRRSFPPLLVTVVVSLAGVFILWSLRLQYLTSHRRAEVDRRVTAVRHLDAIQRQVRTAGRSTLEPWIPGAPQPFVEQVAALLAIGRDEPSIRESLATIEPLLARLAGGAPVDPIELLAARADAQRELDLAIDRTRKDLSDSSTALGGHWEALSGMMLLACLLVAGKAFVLLAYQRDQGRRRRAEEEARRLQAELIYMSRISTMGELSAALAHELNQPLIAVNNYISGCLQRLQKGEGDREALVNALSEAASEASRASAIIQHVRDLVRRRQPDAAPADMNKVVRDVLLLMAGDVDTSGVKVKLALANELPEVFMDRIQIQQVLVNLILNSLEAMSEVPPSERALAIRTAPDGDERVQVVVEDTGRGLSPDALAGLFESFSIARPGGMGMGLAISRTIIEGHGGWIRAEANPDRGATFRFSLPVAGAGAAA